MLRASRYNIPVRLDDGTVIVANTLYGTQVRLSADEFTSLGDGPWVSCRPPSHLEHTLRRAGMLVPVDLDEFGMLRERQQAERIDAERLELTIAPTIACNLGCGYCYEAHKASVSMSKEDEATLLSFAHGQLRGKRELQVTWFGGEPLLAAQSILRISEALIRLCTFTGVAYAATLITNGVLLTATVARRLRAAQVRAVRITIDGPRDVHDRLRPTVGGRGSYDAVLAGVDVARRYFETGIGINVGRGNAARIPQLLEELAARGFIDVGVFFARVTDPDLGDSGTEMPRGGGMLLTVPEFAREEARLLKAARALGLRTVSPDVGTAVPCSAVKANHFVVEPRGVVKRCYAEVSDSAKTVGLLARGTFTAIPRDALWMSYDPLDSECRACSYLPLCHGGCPKMRMNSLDKALYVCTPRRFNLGDLVRSGVA